MATYIGSFSSDLVESRIGNLEGFYLWSSLYHFRQGLQYFMIPPAVVSLRVLFRVPVADCYSFRASWGDKGNLITESLLLAEQQDNFVLDSVEFCGVSYSCDQA
jgi:hypothetical protein